MYWIHPIAKKLASTRQIRFLGGVYVSDRYAYLAGKDYSTINGFVVPADLQVLDVHNPTNPVKLGYLESPVSYVMDIEVHNGYIYLGGLEGLYVFQYGYNADGLVTDMHGIPVSGVELSTNNGMVTASGSSGLYQFTELSPGSETVTPNKSGFAFYPSARVITVPPDAAGINFTLVAAPVQTTLLPDTDAQLVYTDTQGLPTWFEFPSGSVAVTSTVTVTPTLASGSGGMAFARHAFQLGVNQPGGGGQVMSFERACHDDNTLQR